MVDWFCLSQTLQQIHPIVFEICNQKMNGLKEYKQCHIK